MLLIWDIRNFSVFVTPNFTFYIAQVLRDKLHQLAFDLMMLKQLL